MDDLTAEQQQAVRAWRLKQRKRKQDKKLSRDEAQAARAKQQRLMADDDEEPSHERYGRALARYATSSSSAYSVSEDPYLLAAL